MRAYAASAFSSSPLNRVSQLKGRCLTAAAISIHLQSFAVSADGDETRLSRHQLPQGHALRRIPSPGALWHHSAYGRRCATLWHVQRCVTSLLGHTAQIASRCIRLPVVECMVVRNTESPFCNLFVRSLAFPQGLIRAAVKGVYQSVFLP